MTEKHKYIEVIRLPEGDIPIHEATKEQLIQALRSQATMIETFNNLTTGIEMLRSAGMDVRDRADYFTGELKRQKEKFPGFFNHE